MAVGTAHVSINGVDLGDLGVRVQEVVAARSLVSRDWPIRPMPGRGQVALTESPTAQARRVILKGSQEADTLAELQTLRNHLVWYLNRPSTVLRLADMAGAFQRFVVVGADVAAIGPWAKQSAPAHTIQVELLSIDPAWYADAETVLALSGVPVQCPIGNTISRPRIVLNGPMVDPAITYRAADGALRRTMTLKVNIAAGQAVTIDTDAMTVMDNAGVNRISALEAGLWIALDPDDAGGPSGPWPTLTLAPAPSGGASASAMYRIANE